MSEVDFAAREPHFLDHLAPVWKALPRECRGTFHVTAGLESRAERLGIEVSTSPLLFEKKPVLVASVGDLKRVGSLRTPLFLAEHGAGQSYSDANSSYAGGRGPERQKVSLFLVPNEQAAERNRRANPQARVEVVGCPKLDAYLGLKFKRHRKPVIAVSFHWDCKVCPETRWAFTHFRSAIAELSREYEVLGHGHPRAIEDLRPFYEAEGIEVVGDFDEVLKRADLYVCDNSSTLFEFAATGRPVLLLNSPTYRRRVNHGLRFWDSAAVGVQCDRRQDLKACVVRALEDAEGQREARREIVSRVYPHMGRSAALAAKVIVEML